MKKILFLICFLCGCTGTIYVNKPYDATNPENVTLKLREDTFSYVKQLDGNVGCENPEQIAYTYSESIWPLLFVDDQEAIKGIRRRTALLGGHIGSIYDISHY